MTEKKKFLLRLEGDLYSALEKWAADDLRSVNSQIEFLLSESAKRAGRMRQKNTSPAGDEGASSLGPD